MPLYEYRCLECKRRFDVFMTYTEYGNKPVVCKHCGSQQVTRKIGRIRIAKSEDHRLEDFSDPSSLEGLEDDPVALGKMMRKMSGELGEDMPPEFDEVVERLEKGQSPEDIERDLPDLANDLDSGMDAGMGASMDDDF
ncbi:MAG: zinc ribbon domain-containing protein [Anaerolineaceae bacterium]|jgi:putative FmdB family regulatory protein|nr:zinc ribbon domain-containing protein [Anaerolineaceae bacterium]